MHSWQQWFVLGIFNERDPGIGECVDMPIAAIPGVDIQDPALNELLSMVGLDPHATTQQFLKSLKLFCNGMRAKGMYAHGNTSSELFRLRNEGRGWASVDALYCFVSVGLSLSSLANRYGSSISVDSNTPFNSKVCWLFEVNEIYKNEFFDLPDGSSILAASSDLTKACDMLNGKDLYLDVENIYWISLSMNNQAVFQVPLIKDPRLEVDDYDGEKAYFRPDWSRIDWVDKGARLINNKEIVALCCLDNGKAANFIKGSLLSRDLGL